MAKAPLWCLTFWKGSLCNRALPQGQQLLREGRGVLGDVGVGGSLKGVWRRGEKDKAEAEVTDVRD